MHSFRRKVLKKAAAILFLFVFLSQTFFSALRVTYAQENLSASLASARSHISQYNLSPIISSRLDELKARYEDFISSQDKTASIQAISEIPLPQNNSAPFRTNPADQEIHTADANTFSPPQNRKISGSFDKLRTGSFKLQEGSLSPASQTEGRSEVSSLSVSASSIQAESQMSAVSQLSATSQGGEIIITRNIRNKAIALHNDPLQILNFVRTDIAYEPYYGSKKGAEATLRERSGNEADQSALLFALLRAGDDQGNKKTPARYKHATIKSNLRQIMDLVGVDDSTVAARVLGQARIPYTLFTNQQGEPQFFLLEHVYAEAYIEYNEYKGAVQTGDPTAPKQWIPLDPTMLATNHFRSTNILQDMKQQKGFAIETFYDDYLKGKYGTTTPITALKGEITNFLSTSTTTPNRQYADILVQKYRQDTRLEYIPRTLTYDIVTDIGTYDFLPAALRHEFTIKITSNNSTILLAYSGFLSDIANQETVLSYVPASQADAELLASYPSIYDVVPLAMLHLKPVLKVRGNVMGGDGVSALEIQAGQTVQLEMNFTMPGRDVVGTLAYYPADTIAKPAIVGNTEAIAINTGKVIAPEIFPTEDTRSTELLSVQKLYRTALNYLDRLEKSHDELAQITGIQFTHVATRAIVFNGIEVEYAGADPYRMHWRGLRIDSSSVVNTYNRFGTDVNKDLKNFTFPFGLQASYDEAAIFEQEFDGAKAISTVKGILLAAQGVFPTIGIVKITQANSSVIDTLNISPAIKTLFYNAVAKGNTIYTPTSPVTYHTWTGVFYVNLDPTTGFGAYTIGEGLNGGYLATLIYGMVNFFAPTAEASSGETIKASVVLLSPPSTFTDPILFEIVYKLFDRVGNFVWQWIERITTTPAEVGSGTLSVNLNYGATSTSTVPTPTLPKQCLIGKVNCGFDDFILTASTTYGVPGGILKAIFHKETRGLKLFDPHTYRYEPKRDYFDYSSGSDTANALLASTTYKEFAIPGKTANNKEVLKGTLIDSLNPPFATLVRSFATTTPGWGLRTIFYYDSIHDSDSDVTFNDLYLNDLDHTPGSQNWPVGEIPSWNFTPQLVLSASYGLGHVLYLEARGAKNPQDGFIMSKTQTPYDIAYIPQLGIELAASVLKKKFDIVSHGQLIAGDNCAGWSVAIKAYNGKGDEAEKYKKVTCEDIYTPLYSQ